MKKLLAQLVEISYVEGALDSTTVEKIAGKLNRIQLKAYIRALKDHEKKSTVRVEVSGKPSAVNLDELEKIFGKRVHVTSNPDLLLGLRITDNDDVYNMNLKNDLERIVTYAAE